MADITALAGVLGLAFKDALLLEQALVHRSYLNENPSFALSHNERLEFLGDAVLGLVVTEELYRNFPGRREGEMTRLRATLVRREALARIAGDIGLGDYLYLGKGEEASGGRGKPANLAGAMEAVLAAVYLDQGLPAARGLILRLLQREITRVARQETEVDYKSRLQEALQLRRTKPAYVVREATGPEHERHFTVEVSDGNNVLGTGAGRTKKMAEMAAARMALEYLANDFTD